MKGQLFSWRQAVLESNLRATTKHVLLTLSCYMNDMGGSCFPTIDRLARDTSLSRKSVIEHLRHAREGGWLTVELHGYGGQRWANNEYAVSFPQAGEPATPALAPEGSEPPSPASDEGGEPLSKGGEPDGPKVVNYVHSNSSVNSSSNSPEPLPGKKAGRKRRAKETLQAYIADCKTEGIPAIPDDDPVFDYADKVRIPRDWVWLAWREFVTRHTENGKKQKSWPQTFRNCVRDNWYRLWWIKGDERGLTTQGEQAQAFYTPKAVVNG